jgi:hypothetical protein
MLNSLEPGQWGHPVSFRLINWGPNVEAGITIETAVGHLPEGEREAVLAACNALAAALVEKCSACGQILPTGSSNS